MQQNNKSPFSYTVRLSVLLIILILTLFRVTANLTQAHTHATLSGNMLLASNREELAVCVEVIDGTSQVTLQTLANNVNIALDQQISAHPRWSELGYDKFPNRVDASCPTAPYLLQPGAAHPLLPGSEKAEVPVPMVEVPSPYRIHLYVVFSEEIMQAFGASDLRSAPQEMLCDGTQCFEVTSALYLTPEETMNSEILKDRLERILALNLVDVKGE